MYTVSLPSVILLTIRDHTPCRFSLFNLFVSIKLEETGDYSHHNFCFKIRRIFGWLTRIFAGVSYRKLALLKQFCYIGFCNAKDSFMFIWDFDIFESTLSLKYNLKGKVTVRRLE